jgi:glycosyltransferase involved in cell wall biosynthesis
VLRLSIGVPVCNGENFLAEALDSILAQTFPDFELIVSDNASTDGTAEISRAYAARDPRVRYHRQERRVGAAENHNRVFRLAGAPYFKWHAHDDVLAPEFLARCVEILDRYPEVILAHTLTRVIDERGAVIGICPAETRGYDAPQPQRRFGSRVSRVRIPLPLAGHRYPDVLPIWGVIRSEVLARTPLFGFFSGADDVLLAQLALLGPFYRAPEYLFFLREHAGKSSRVYRGRRRHAVWFDPGNDGRIVLPDCRMFAEFVRSVRSAPLSAAQQAGCYARMVPYFLWNWPRMARDVAVAVGLWLERQAGLS